MNPCCEHLYREALKEIKIRDSRIKELQDGCTRLFEPTREFWNQERAKPLVDAMEKIQDYAHDRLDRELEIIAWKALKQYRGEE